MKCTIAELKAQIDHARNAETRHLAEIGELAAEIVHIKNRLNILTFQVQELVDKISPENKSNC